MKFSTGLCILLLIQPLGWAKAAQTVHLTLTGATIGPIPGDSTQTSLGRQNTIECLALNHEVVTPRDASSGLPTGRRQHMPLTIVKRIDKSSPVLHRAMGMNENLSGTFRHYRPSPSGDGTTQQYYTITCTNARIVSIRQWQPSVLDPTSSALPEMEEVSFTYGTITWTYTDGNVTHQEDW